MDTPANDMSWRSAKMLACAFVLAGFALRCLAATGGLWTDEAWSVVLVQEVGSVWGILTQINHDNNHHINGIWLLLVGPEAPPIVTRGLSIVTSTATIWFAALIGFRQSRTTGVLAAAFFAISPIMVIYGSEARGYAPMMLALLLMIYRIDRWLEDQSQPPRLMILSVLALLGTFSHLTMAPAVILLAIWVVLANVHDQGFSQSVKIASALMGTAVTIALAVMALVLTVAAASPTGILVGGYIPFSWAQFGEGMISLLSLSTGIGIVETSAFATLAFVLIVIMLVTMRRKLPPARFWCLGVLLISIPLAVAVIQPGNSQYARYYLPSAVAIIMLMALWIGQAAHASGYRQKIAALLLVISLGLGLAQDYEFIKRQRGQPENAVLAMARMAPGGADVSIEVPSPEASLSIAAAHQDYPLRVKQARCGTAPFHFSFRHASKAAPAIPIECATTMRFVASGVAYGPSGQSWAVYAQQRLPRTIVAVNSPPPRQ